MKNLFTVMRSKGVIVGVAVSALFAAGAAQAQTALPAWTSTIATDAQAAATESADLVGPVIGAVIVSLVVIKLIKRFSSKI